MSDVIREMFDGPPQLLGLGEMSDDELRRRAEAGDLEAARMLLDRPAPPDWQERMSERMGRARGQA